MNDDLIELYQELILEHHKRPRNNKALGGATHRAAGHNPLCGDEIEVYLEVKEGRVAAISFQGQGCAISRASASMMTTALEGKSVEEARACFSRIQKILSGGTEEVGLETLGDLASLQGVRKFPARIKCATLPWHAFKAALDGTSRISTETPVT